MRLNPTTHTEYEKRMSTTPWAVINYATQPPVLECQRCKATAPFSLPMNIDQVIILSDQFCKAHQACPPPKAATPAQVIDRGWTQFGE